MEKKCDNNVELIEEEEIVTLYDDQNKPVDFYEVACVEFEENFYALLQPVKPISGISDDEVIIFKLEEQEDDTDLFLPVDNEELLEKVFNEYIKAVADEEGNCGCGCGKDHDCDCDDDCDHDKNCHDSDCDCKHSK